MDGRGMPIDVIYIAGAPRSGTTILSQLLGELPGLFNVGEARFLWRQVLSSGRCGCGTRLIACDFWREVLTDSPVPSGDDRTRTLAAAALTHSRLRTLPWELVVRRLGGSLPRALREHAAATIAVYHAAAAAAHASAIVDASKSPSFAYALTASEGVRLHVVHVVRDPRAVVHSWLRSQSGASARVRGRGVLYSALKWSAWNVLTELIVRPSAATYARLRYEDVARAPAALLSHIAPLASQAGPGGRIGLLEGETSVVELSTNHTVFGNGQRFISGPVRVEPDEEWRVAMSRRARATVIAFTWPLLRRYGFNGRDLRRIAL